MKHHPVLLHPTHHDPPPQAVTVTVFWPAPCSAVASILIQRAQECGLLVDAVDKTPKHLTLHCNGAAAGGVAEAFVKSCPEQWVVTIEKN